jgi:hypothetical protein
MEVDEAVEWQKGWWAGKQVEGEDGQADRVCLQEGRQASR